MAKNRTLFSTNFDHNYLFNLENSYIALYTILNNSENAEILFYKDFCTTLNYLRYLAYVCVFSKGHRSVKKSNLRDSKPGSDFWMNLHTFMFIYFRYFDFWALLDQLFDPLKILFCRD